MVQCFHKYDNINVNDQGIENIATDQVEDAQAKDVGMEDNLLV